MIFIGIFQHYDNGVVDDVWTEKCEADNVDEAVEKLERNNDNLIVVTEEQFKKLTKTL